MIIGGVEQLGIPNLRRVSDTVFSGPTLEGKTLSLLKLKDAGISTIVDFRGDATAKLAQECQKLGMEYMQFPLDHTLSVGKKSSLPRKVATDFVIKMKKFFEIMNKGNAYVGCNYGIDRTNVGLAYNYFLNPKAEASCPPIILTWADSPNVKGTINRLIRCIQKTVKSMSPEQKAMLSIKGNSLEIFQTVFKSKIGKMIYRNLRYIR